MLAEVARVDVLTDVAGGGCCAMMALDSCVIVCVVWAGLQEYGIGMP